MLFGFGFPATITGGFGGAIPAAGFGIAPFGFPFFPGFFGKPFFPATIGGGFGSAVPATTVATSPFPI